MFLVLPFYVCFDMVLLNLIKRYFHSISSCPSYACAQSNITLLARSCWNVALCQQTWYCSTPQLLLQKYQLLF